MKKTMKKLLMFLGIVLIIILIILGAKVGQILAMAKQENIPPEVMSSLITMSIEQYTPFSSLTTHNRKLEKDIVENIIKSSYLFYSPSDIEVLEVYGGEVYDETKEDYINVKIQGKNALNGTITKNYIIYFNDTKFGKAGTMEESNSIMIDEMFINKNIRIKKINKKLKKHWKDLGI